MECAVLRVERSEIDFVLDPPILGTLEQVQDRLAFREQYAADRASENFGRCLWPAPFTNDTPETQYRFLTECCVTLDEETGQQALIPALPHVRYVSDLMYWARIQGMTLIFMKSRRLLVSWVRSAVRFYEMGRSNRTGRIAGETYDKAHEHVWRIAWMYRHLQRIRKEWHLPSCEAPASSTGNYTSQKVRAVIFPNGSLVEAINQDEGGLQGRGNAFVDLEEASTYKNLAWVAGQAQIITQGREDVVGGTVCLVANANGAHEEWMTLKKIARIVQNNDTSWRTE